MLLVILTDRLTIGSEKSIIAIEVGVVNKDVFIFNIEIMGYTASIPDFDKMNEPAKLIVNHDITDPYQQLERFYGGYINTMTTIKDTVLDIINHEWHNDPDIEVF